MQDHKLPLTGGCQCGALRYEIAAQPAALYVCHCRECQRQSTSAFGMSMPVPSEAVRITAGAPRTWSRQADSGNLVDCVFCPECGTRVMHKPARNPAIVNIKPGTLDDTSWLRPIGHLWTGSAQPWTASLHVGVVCPAQPGDFASLFAEWREQQRAGER